MKCDGTVCKTSSFPVKSLPSQDLRPVCWVAVWRVPRVFNPNWFLNDADPGVPSVPEHIFIPVVAQQEFLFEFTIEGKWSNNTRFILWFKAKQILYPLVNYQSYHHALSLRPLCADSIQNLLQHTVTLHNLLLLCRCSDSCWHDDDTKFLRFLRVVFSQCWVFRLCAQPTARDNHKLRGVNM